MKDYVSAIAKSPVVQKLENLVPKYSLVGDSIFFGTEQFPWAKELEANWKIIRQELEQVLHHIDALANFQDIMPQQHGSPP